MKHTGLITLDDLEVEKLDKKEVMEALAGKTLMFKPENLKGVFYKDVLIFTTVSESIDDYDLWVWEEVLGENESFFTIQLRDEHGDYYHYGKFSTLKEIKDWLDNPTPIY